MRNVLLAQCLFLVGSLSLWGCRPVVQGGQNDNGGAGGAGGSESRNGGSGGSTSGGSCGNCAGSGGNAGGSGGKGGSAGSSGGAGGKGGSAGSGGSGSGGKGGSAGTSGGSGGGSAGGSAGSSSGGAGGGSGGSTADAAPACVADLSNLVTPTGWVCAADTEAKIQGAFYVYDDGASCTKVDNPCSSSGCCVSGTTVVDTTYAKWGCGLGLELNSTGGDPPVKSQYAGPVKCFNIELSGDSGNNEVRVGFTQAASDNKVSPYVPIAAFKSGWKGQVCFTDAECPEWSKKDSSCTKAVGTAGTPYDMQIQVSAGSSTTSVGKYNVCVTKIEPVTSGGGGAGGGGGTSSCSSSTGQGTISDPYGTAHVTCNGQDYIVQNNAWGSTAGQTINYGPGTKFEVTVQKASMSGTGSPASYPSLFIGANGGRSTSNSGLPKTVSSLGSVQTSWSWSGGNAADTFNAAYDVWFSTGSGGDPSSSSPSGGYLMVWYHKPTGATPIGEMKESTTIAGKNWNVYFGNNSGNNKPCVSFVAPQSLNSLSFNLKDFIDYAVKKSYGIQSGWSLTNVFAGFEIWSGGVGLKTTDFSVSVK